MDSKGETPPANSDLVEGATSWESEALDAWYCLGSIVAE